MPTPVKDVVFQTSAGPPAPASITGYTVVKQTSAALLAATDTQIAAARATRRFLNIINLSSSETIYLTFDGTAAAAGMFSLPPGAAFDDCVSVDLKTFLGEIRGFSTNASTYAILECD